MGNADNWNLRITLRGLLVTIALAAVFLAVRTIPLPDSTWKLVALGAIKSSVFCAALAAPFERALIGACLGLAFVAFVLILGLMVFRGEYQGERRINKVSVRVDSQRLPIWVRCSDTA